LKVLKSSKSQERRLKALIQSKNGRVSAFEAGKTHLLPPKTTDFARGFTEKLQPIPKPFRSKWGNPM
jgi:ribosomal protein L35